GEAGAGDVRVRGLHAGRGQQQLPAGAERAQGQHAPQRRRLPRRRPGDGAVQQRLPRCRLHRNETGTEGEPAGVPVARATPHRPAPQRSRHRRELCFCRSRHPGLNQRGEQYPTVEAGAVHGVNQGRHGGQGGQSRGAPPALEVLLPLQRRQQRHLRVRGRAGRRRRALRQTHLRLLRGHHGPVRHGREEVRDHQRGASGLRAGGAGAQRDWRVQRRAQPAVGRLQRQAQVPHGRPRRPAAGPRLLPRRQLQPLASHLRQPGGIRVREHRQRVLREWEDGGGQRLTA
ncbi:hypothetical protein CFC21_059338, partial [Triticum aestivum]|uniref:Uncharacterized protein n=2 Tax=Triticum aestivum TaxID=4565 RepID=A0A3B6IYJ8_WHEAT